jgi:hypothetical protein
VIDDHDQIPVPAFVGDLVDPDPSQPPKAIDRRVDVRIDSGDDRADRAPRHPQQFHYRALRGPHREPRRQIIEVAGVAGTVTRPRHRRHDHSMITTPHPRCASFEEHPSRAEIQRPPPTTPLSGVITS